MCMVVFPSLLVLQLQGSAAWPHQHWALLCSWSTRDEAGLCPLCFSRPFSSELLTHGPRGHCFIWGYSL